VLTRMLYSPHSEARFRASWITPALDALYTGHMRPCLHRSSVTALQNSVIGGHTLFAIDPLILPISTMLPPCPNLIICFAAACAVMNTPVTLIDSMRFASSAVYSNAGVSCWMPAAAISPSSRPCLSAISVMILFRFAISHTSVRR